MLALTRRIKESIVIEVPPKNESTYMEIKVVEIQGDRVRLSFEAPRAVQINRKELYIEKQKSQHPYQSPNP